MFNAQNAATSIFIGASIGTYDRVIRTDFWQQRLKEIAFPVFFVHFKIAGVCSGSGDEPAEIDHAKLREFLLVTLSDLRFFCSSPDERIIAEALTDN
jgi:hypothetical protein